MKLKSRDTILFSIAVGLAAIFMDAVIAHGLYWENDPYWTYWVTKTVLITSVFLVGTAFIGIGIKQGLIITLFHTIILEAYYDWFAPIGLPQEPFWLPVNDLWTTGFVTHYLTILAGYMVVVWIWGRTRPKLRPENETSPDPKPLVIWALVASLLVVVIDLVITHFLLLGSFPGWTLLIQHLLIGLVFFAVIGAFVGLDASGWLVASAVLALIWTGYSMYVSPVGLPAEYPHYLGYRELWFKMFPGSFISTLLGLFLAGLIVRYPVDPTPDAELAEREKFSIKVAGIAVIIAVLLLLPGFIRQEAQGGDVASASASGEAMRIVGDDPYNINSTQPVSGAIDIHTRDINNRWSALQGVDELDVNAEFSSGEDDFVVTIKRVMARDPNGKTAYWSGVVYDATMHGPDSFVGTPKLPEVTPEIALWGFADVEMNGELVAKNVPAHVMVMQEGPLAGIALEVAPEDKSITAVPDGYIHVHWGAIDSIALPTQNKLLQELFGWAVLLFFVVVFWWLARRELQPADRKIR